jgi:uncharacterized protein YjiK
MRTKTLASLVAMALTPFAAQAAVISVDLSTYQLSGNYSLSLIVSPKAWEASSVTWNKDNGRLYVIEDEGRRVYEMSTAGAVLSSMTLSGFDDTEGLTYMGGGKFVLAEERIQSAYQFSYVPGGTLTKSASQAISLGPTVGNVGLEGISFDPLSGKFVTVKEKTPMGVNLATIDFPSATATVNSLFDPSGLGVADLADVQVLTTVSSLIGTPDEQHLLLLSQESRRLLETDRAGTVYSFYDLTSLSGSIEGVTIDNDGNIYLVSEEVAGGDPHLFVLSPSPVPVPAAFWLLLSGMGAGVAAIRRRRTEDGTTLSA